MVDFDTKKGGDRISNGYNRGLKWNLTKHNIATKSNVLKIQFQFSENPLYSDGLEEKLL